MPVQPPNFSPYPFAQLRKLTRTDAAIESVLARWIAALSTHASAKPSRLARLVGASGVSTRVLGVNIGASAIDPHAALAEVRALGHSIIVATSSAFAREVAQRLLGGVGELAAPRPLTQAEHAMFALVVAAALEDAGLPGEVWPVTDEPLLRSQLLRTEVRFAISVGFAGRGSRNVVVAIPTALLLEAPPPRPPPAWELALPVQLGACFLPADAAVRLELRDVIIIERGLGLVFADGLIALRAAPGALEATVVNEYVRRVMALPDDAHLELTVQLGTTRLSVRQLAELAPGTVVPLGRPLAGPFEVRVAGRLVGQGELLDVDGELGVRIVSLQE